MCYFRGHFLGFASFTPLRPSKVGISSNQLIKLFNPHLNSQHQLDIQLNREPLGSWNPVHKLPTILPAGHGNNTNQTESSNITNELAESIVSNSNGTTVEDDLQKVSLTLLWKNIRKPKPINRLCGADKYCIL